MRRLTAIAASITVAVAGLATTTAATAAPDHRPVAKHAPVKARGYTPPPLVWHACDNPTLVRYGSQCADLVVPLDYSKPRGRKITLAVSRLLHSAPDSQYQGVMLVNPGGPGGSGLIYSVFGQGRFVPGDGDLDYDWIGFDPRGVGDSRPALSCDGSYFGYDRPNYVPTTRKLERTWLKLSEKYATDCKYAPGSRILKHAKTTDSVADMESLRKALGRQRLNFYGFSYGTYLGSVYATLHPTRVRRFVFDGSVDPTRVWYKANLDQDVAFQKTIEVYFGWLAEHDDVYHLGTNADAIERGYYRQLDKLDAAAAGGVIGPDELADVMLSAGYYVYGWEDLGAAYAKLVNDGDESGIKAMYDDANPQTPGSDNGYAMYLATQCTDAPWPQRWNKIRTDNWRTYAKAPFETWANAWFNGPCSFWPAKAAKPVHVTGKDVDSKILMIGETLDAATPFSGSLKLRKLFPTASLIEGVGGTTHSGSLSGVACTDDAIGRYLTDGTVPARTRGNHSDLQCPPVPQPDPTPAASSSRRGLGAPGMSPILKELRQQLAEAQMH